MDKDKIKMRKLIIFCVIGFQWTLSTSVDDDLIITLPDGQIQGAVFQTPNNVTYYGWRGIPFGKPPIGKLRFQAPQPASPWDGVWDATKEGKSCVSTFYLNNQEDESEDCLFVNVYTRTVKPATKLPVMFWIYGGGFTSGYSFKSKYGPDFLVEQDIIFVSVNYRAGPLGFLSTEDSVIRGNAGLKDQNLGLKWTYDNIAFFGGDPKKITISGQSAGGASTGLHLVSKRSAGLFRAAIIESGSATTLFSIKDSPRSYAFLLANTISAGDYGNDSQILNDFLLERTPEEITTAQNILGVMTSPVIEVDDEEAFLSESPYQLLQSGNFNQVPIIAGMCAEESLFKLGDLENTIKEANATDVTPTLLIPEDLHANSTDYDVIIDEIKNIYLKGSKLWSNDLVALAEFVSDNIFTNGIIKHAELGSNYIPVYLYHFGYYGRARFPAFLEGAEKATHGAEIPFLFNMVGYQDTDPANLLTQSRVVKLWTNFVKFLNPIPEKSELLNTTWPTFNSTSQPYLNINGTLDLRFHPKQNSYPKWSKIYEIYGNPPFNTF